MWYVQHHGPWFYAKCFRYMLTVFEVRTGDICEERVTAVEHTLYSVRKQRCLRDGPATNRSVDIDAS